jgi:DNA-directed RNA polymerase I, II, and III subunit RPABC1
MWSGWEKQLSIVEEMLQVRGYVSLKAICHGLDPMVVCSCKDIKDKHCFVYFTKENKMGVKLLRKIRTEALHWHASHIIIVTPDGLTPFASKELSEADSSELEIEIFKKDELSFNILKHRFVPKHTLLTSQERSEVLAKLDCKASQLPKLKETDPVAKFMHYAPGSVIRIDRRIGLMESEVYYRLVVP